MKRYLLKFFENVSPRVAGTSLGVRLYLGAGLLWLLLSWTGPALAWDFAGHFLTGAVAYSQLDPPVKAEAERLLLLLAGAEPAVTGFVPATAWLDAQSWNPDFALMDDWHYLALGSSAQLSAGRLAEVSVMAVRTLAGPRSTDFQKALMLRVLLHTVGDMHQPLHTINRVTQAHPEGDKGGKAFGLQGPYPNLHALWDAAGGQYPYLQLADWQKALPLAQALQAEFPAASFGVRPANPHAFVADFLAQPQRWIEESHQLALQMAYQNIEANQRPSPAYIRQVQQISRRQLAMAGYRLAHLLNACLKVPGPRP